MKQKIEAINTDFFKNISEIYLDPPKINKYIRKHSNFTFWKSMLVNVECKASIFFG